MKIRAWDEQRKKMQTSAKWVEFRIIDGEVKAFNYNFCGREVELPVLQFIGCVDINGKEVYEGDVVHIEKDKFGEGRDEVWIIEKGYFGDCQWYTSNQLNSGRLIDTYESSGIVDNTYVHPAQFSANGTDIIFCEVIGNIYENPEYNKE